jgi:hypothetical protein
MHTTGAPIQQAEAGWFNRRELQQYLGVGKNAVAAIADRFGLNCIDGSYDERDVWRRILDLEPVHDHGVHLLRMPLRDIHWIAGRVGKAPSTVRNEIASGAFRFGRGVQIAATDTGRDARTRRWCEPVFNAELRSVALASVRKPTGPISGGEDLGLPPLDDAIAFIPTESVAIEPSLRLRL